MTTWDFSRSFATFVTGGRGNNARIQVEAVCEIAGGERYVLVASCKAEDTYAEENLFREPNYRLQRDLLGKAVLPRARGPSTHRLLEGQRAHRGPL